MALAGLRVFGVLLLLNLATEIRGHSYSHPIDVIQEFRSPLNTCFYGPKASETEFHKIKYGSLDTYRRRTVSSALLQCITSKDISRTNENIAEPLDCFKYANEQSEKYSILYYENGWCVFSSVNLPESFLDCPDPSSKTKVIYTSDSVRFSSMEEILQDAEPIDSCSIEISDSTAKIVVSDSGSCKSDLYSVKFMFDGTEREETMVNNMESSFDADIPQCTLVNVTISRLLVAGVPLGSDTCETAVITDPAEAELVENENDLVLITEPCEFLQYRVELAPDSGAVYRGPFPVDGIPVSFPKAEVGSSLIIEFLSDFDIRLPGKLQFPTAKP